jgi:beta-galactosidase
VADTAPLSRYKLVVAPALNLLTPEAAKNLEAYVRAGGHLVLGQRSAMKDQDNGLYPQRQPGPLAELLGARVEEWYALERTVPIEGDWGSGEDKIWAERLGVQSPETQVLMRYGKSNGWLDGQPAAVTRKVGSGSITYIGAELDGPTMQAAAKWMLTQSGVQPVMPDLPESVDLSIRSGEGKRILILTNYGAEPQTIALPEAMEDLLQGGKVSSVTLPQYGVAVLQ